MSTRADHRRLLQRGRFPVPADVPGLTASQRHLLVRHGFWLEALANGALTPSTKAQHHFVSVAQGRAAPSTEHERAWLKMRPPAAKGPATRLVVTPAALSPEEESVLRGLRAMLARREVISGFADSVLRQWEESGRVTSKQLAAVRRLMTKEEGRAALPRVATGGARKRGSHRSNW